MPSSLPLLTIAIPTWNRAEFLALNLKTLCKQIENCNLYDIELLVSDNDSEDKTQLIVQKIIQQGHPIRYVRNKKNIGSDKNIAQCFNLASGNYVLILGDDDFLLEGTLRKIHPYLYKKEQGVICIKAYGFDKNYQEELPSKHHKHTTFSASDAFLIKINSKMTLISSCIINKTSIIDVNANSFCGSNLVQTNLVIRAALKNRKNTYMNEYLVACKRNNSGGYVFTDVFVKKFTQVLDNQIPYGLSKSTIKSIERNLLISYYPFYLLKSRLIKSPHIKYEINNLEERYKRNWLYKIWVKPILTLPYPLAIIWGGATTLIGRLLNDDFYQGTSYILRKIRSRKLYISK